MFSSTAFVGVFIPHRRRLSPGFTWVVVTVVRSCGCGLTENPGMVQSQGSRSIAGLLSDRFCEVTGPDRPPVNGSTDNEFRGKVGKPAYLRHWSFTGISPLAGESKFSVNFDWDEEIGKPGALLIKNNHRTEFYLKSITLENVPGHGRIHFVCNSWVYPDHKYEKPRLFFTNETYLPREMPEALRKYREEELNALRGNGEGELQEWDRVYGYAYYNDLGNPDLGPEFVRPVPGGSTQYPLSS
ncbi:hypothetical protein F3Y22_tig00004355pilonHSYRG00099 [Hibiscus syriacus]|uniref:Lipoxygenase n=1 Tax=Hibiscus syriacus TaxID=106335 RepID=A0A6A3CMN3_HIBSY|nr:hypothetical protein F3Y22_tig00004355pilonHSYRG00099 [Hibiscus syriacus]